VSERSEPTGGNRPTDEDPSADLPQDGDFAEAIVATISQPLLVLDGTLKILCANPAFFERFQVTPDETSGRQLYQLGNGQWDIPELRRLLEEILTRQGMVKDYRVEHEFEQIGQRIMLINASRMRRDGDADRILLAISDITETERLRFELEGRKEFAEKLIDSIREGLVVMDWDLRVISANLTFYETFKVDPAETEGRLIYELGNGQWDIPRLRELLSEILPKHTTFNDFEVEHHFENIGHKIMLLNARQLDHLKFVLLAIRDVTAQRLAESEQKALMGELQHRVKNILSSVQSLAQQTRQRSRNLDEFAESFRHRLGALARAQDLLLRSPHVVVELADLVQFELQAFGAHEGANFTLQGPKVRLPARFVQAMAMTIHELTTNAAKYGALSGNSGRIEITWRTARRGETNHLQFHWREHGVPIDTASAARGFGSQVIEDMLPYMLGGQSNLTFHPDGADCMIEFPLPEE
jgi:two-component sensor histidine kinase/PAS domain-containing protein